MVFACVDTGATPVMMVIYINNSFGIVPQMFARHWPGHAAVVGLRLPVIPGQKTKYVLLEKIRVTTSPYQYDLVFLGDSIHIINKSPFNVAFPVVVIIAG
jgi:hypothetical protein